MDKTQDIPVESMCAVNSDATDKKERSTILLILHRQFAHPSKKRLIALLTDAGV